MMLRALADPGPVPPLTMKRDEDPVYLAVDAHNDLVISIALIVQTFIVVNYTRDGVVQASLRPAEECLSAVDEGERRGYRLYRCDELTAYLVSGRTGVKMREKIMAHCTDSDFLSEVEFIVRLAGAHKAIDDAKRNPRDVHRAYVSSKYKVVEDIKTTVVHL